MITNSSFPSRLEELGERIARHRLNQNLTQEELARRAGIGSATLKRIEHGSASTQMGNLINVLHALGMDQNLDLLIPDVPASPVQLARLERKNVRQRASRKRKARDADSAPTWTWADDHHS